MQLRTFLTAITLTLATAAAMAQETSQQQIAFPGAEGYGKWATGGRGGKTYVVTSLDDCPEGSLKQGTFRWAVKQPGKKIVTFAVCGTIYLTSPLNLDCGDLTILGQTAPGDGICLADYPVTISCENAILRYLRFRLGQRQVEHHEGDGFGFNGADNVIMDHCSVSWSIDECLSISAATNLTIQWCMVEQALNDAGHSKGAHGYGGNWGGTNVSFHHNLITQCTSRVPRLGGDTSPYTHDFCDLRNNVFYNWGGLGCYGAEAIDVNFAANYYKPGPCTDQRSALIRKRICAVGIRTNSYVKQYPAFAHDLHKWGHFYAAGNVNPDYDDVTRDNWQYGIVAQVTAADQDGTWTATTRDTIHLSEPREFATVTTHTAEEAYERVLLYAGASLYRDCMDNLMVAQVQNRLGDKNSGSNGAQYGQIDRQTDNGFSASEVENGAWPLLKTRLTGYEDSDYDGIDDQYEDTWGLDSTDPTDAARLFTGSRADYKGYSYVEIYQNFINKKRREWNAAPAEGGVAEGTDDLTIRCLRRLPWEHEISQLTFKGYDAKLKRQLFADGLSMDATASISGGTGEEQTLKLKSGRKYTIHVPPTIKATGLRLYGYANYGTDFYVSELDGQLFGATEYLIAGAGKAKAELFIPFGHEVSGRDLTITFTGDSQPTLRLYLAEDPTSHVGFPTANGKHPTVCHDLTGRAVGRPTRGLYIISGRKVIVR